MDFIDYGGYGCIFSPELECASNRKSRKLTKKYIGKLQKEEDTSYEYNMMNKILSVIKKNIPNYQNYFVLDDIHVCKPKLSRSELIEKYKDCPVLKKTRHLKQLIIPNMGVNLQVFFENELSTLDDRFIKYNNKLIELYVKGVIPMNKLGFYHNDLKLSNIVVLDNFYRIIDFGLMNDISYKYFAFNNPFNSILLSDKFIEYYTKHKSRYTNTEIIRKYLSRIQLSEQVHYKDIIEPTLQIMHLETITEDTGNIHPLLFNYYVDGITNSSNMPYSQIARQKKQIYVHNVDTIGFLSIYSYVYLLYFKKYQYTTEPELLSEIKKIYLKYIFIQDKISYKMFIQDIAKLNLCF
jgi:hypothetical protein